MPFRNATGLPEAKTWVHCTPSKSLRTFLVDRDFRIWLQCYSQLPLFQPNMECPRWICNEVFDVYGDHMLYSKYGSQRIWGHDAQVKLLSSDLSKAARHPVLQPRPSNGDRERPEIRALGSRGGTGLFDVSFTHTLTMRRSRNRRRVVNTLSVLKETWRGKILKYRNSLTQSGPSHEQ